MNRPILVVDDDDSVRFMLARLLRSRGFETLNAANASIARLVAEEHHVGLFIIDIVMPGESGLELAAHVLATWPTTPIVLISGYASEEPIAFARGHDHIEFIGKPFGADDVLAIIEGLLGPTPA